MALDFLYFPQGSVNPLKLIWLIGGKCGFIYVD